MRKRHRHIAPACMTIAPHALKRAGIQKVAAPALLVLSLAACEPIGPSLELPAINVDQSFSAAATQTQLTQAASNDWWVSFDDQVLSDLVERGVIQNLEVQVAAERIIAAEAVLSQTGGISQVSGSLSAQSSRQRFEGLTTDQSSAVVRGSYIIDFLGGSTRSRQQAEALLDASEMDAGAVRLAVLADITSTYILARYYEQSAAITRAIIRSRRKTLDAVQSARDLSRATEVDLQTAKAELATQEARLPSFQSAYKAQVLKLATLTVQPSEAVDRMLSARAGQPMPNRPPLSGIPADLLRNRPDVRAAEAQLTAASAAVGVAMTELYPRLTLNGLVGLDGADSWNFASSLIFPIIGRGIIQSRIAIAESEARQAEMQWRRSVSAATEEVRSALSQHDSWNRQIAALDRARIANDAVLDLRRNAFSVGSGTITDILDAEGRLANSLLDLANARQGAAQSWVDIHLRTGQGWQTTGQTPDGS